MNSLLRFSVSGLLGLIVVAALFFMMFVLLKNDHKRPISSQQTVNIVKFIPPIPSHLSENKPIEIQKEKRKKPLLQQAPNLQLSETGSIESGEGVKVQPTASGTEYGTMLGGVAGESSGVGGLAYNHLYKYYEHNLSYPKKAAQAGVMQGKLIANAVFSKSHEFLRFEIIEEYPVEYFRDVLYQLKFVKNSHNHLFHPKHNVYKGTKTDAKGIHSSTYQFIFDLNSAEPVKFYIKNNTDYENISK